MKLFDCSQFLFRFVNQHKAHPKTQRRSSMRAYISPFLLLLCLVFVIFPAWAQSGASISGVVTDQGGASLPNTTVTIKNLDTGATRTSTTDSAGHFQ